MFDSDLDSVYWIVRIPTVEQIERKAQELIKFDKSKDRLLE